MAVVRALITSRILVTTTLEHRLYRGWTVYQDPAPLWEGARWGGCSDEFETCVSNTTPGEVMLKIDDIEDEATLDARPRRLRRCSDGDHDIMVPSENSSDLARRISGVELILYPDAGHGGMFQYNDELLLSSKIFLAG